MIKITLGTNTSRKSVIVDENTTIRDLLNENNINMNMGTTTVDGAPLTVSDMGKTLSELRITEGAYVINVIKADNANI